MAADLTLAELRIRLANADLGDPWDVLARVAQLSGDPEIGEEVGRDLVIRLLERRDELDAFEPIVSSLARTMGLSPYVDPTVLDDSSALALEAHRPLGDAMGDVVFHESQAYVYRLLMDGHNVMLSAPTSYGKSLINDAVLSSRPFRNAAVIVPTIALLDETRRRLTRLPYKVITHSSQSLRERNLFVMTQERLLEFPDLPAIEFFAIDEFYKLDPSMDPDRALLLNQALYRLLKKGGQFYILGPDIQQLAGAPRLEARFVRAPFKTVALDVHHVSHAEGDLLALATLASRLEEPTLIYCRSPKRTREVAEQLLTLGEDYSGEPARLAADWVDAEFHPEWTVARALRRGIGVHHGRLPRALAHHVVRLFNQGDLRFLVCTSTLIEGVNTRAKNVVVFDNTVARTAIDFFTFNNIRGRSGRMFQHFIGNVYLFHREPEEQLPLVDVPALTQSEATRPELLIQLDQEDLTPTSQSRLQPYMVNPWLSPEVLRSNTGVSLDGQIAVARSLREAPESVLRLLSWSGLPTYEELQATCQLIWRLADGSARSSVAVSFRQLAFLMNQLSSDRGLVRPIVGYQVSRGADADDAVEDVLAFIRSWPGHHMPKLLVALQRIEEEVFAFRGMRPGNYLHYASRVESLFLPQFAAALEEYGVPYQVSTKVAGLLENAQGLDDVLARLSQIDLGRSDLGQFERVVVSEARQSLPTQQRG